MKDNSINNILEEIIKEIDMNRNNLCIINKFQTNTYVFKSQELGLVKLELISLKDNNNYCAIYVNGVLEGKGGINNNLIHNLNPLLDAIESIEDIDIKISLKKAFEKLNYKLINFPKKL